MNRECGLGQDQAQQKDSGVSAQAVRDQLARILESPPFRTSQRLRDLLSYVVTQVLENNPAELKEYSLATRIFGRPHSFDPRLDPIVRVQASNLRARLREFYLTTGQQDQIVIELPRGTYVPRFFPKAQRENDHPTPPHPSAEEFVSIAVLPCIDLSPEQSNEPFCDGLTEEIIRALSAARHVRVVGRTSVFRFKGKRVDIRKTGEQLGVQNILESSLRGGANRIRITARLIDVATGFTLWSKVFDFEAGEIFSVQEEIARSIARVLGVKFSGDEEKVFEKRVFQDVESHNLYLLARFHLNRRTGRSLRRSKSIFETLLAKDPSNGHLLVGLAECHLLLAIAGAVNPSSAMPESALLSRKALSFDNKLSDAHLVLGSIMALHEWDWEGAEREFHRALRLGRSGPAAQTSYAFCCLLPVGRSSEAIDIMREAVELDPLSLNANLMLAFALYTDHRYMEAASRCDKVIDLEPTFSRAHALQALAYELNGQHQQAIRKADMALKLRDAEFFVATRAIAVCVYALAGQRQRALTALEALAPRAREKPSSRYWPGLAYTALGRIGKALQLLEQGVIEHDPWIVSMAYEPLLDRLRGNPRFDALLAKFGLPQRASGQGHS